MPRRNASSVPAPSIAPSGIHDSEVTDDSIRTLSSFSFPAAFSLARSLDARGFADRNAPPSVARGRCACWTGRHQSDLPVTGGRSPPEPAGGGGGGGGGAPGGGGQ